nr:MAG TPA: hypothetical protein [Caudoviricetes sp.]
MTYKYPILPRHCIRGHAWCALLSYFHRTM